MQVLFKFRHPRLLDVHRGSGGPISEGAAFGLRQRQHRAGAPDSRICGQEVVMLGVHYKAYVQVNGESRVSKVARTPSRFTHQQPRHAGACASWYADPRQSACGPSPDHLHRYRGVVQ